MFRLAQYLWATPVSTIQDETRWRAAINRSYYCCFLTTRDRLWGIDGRPSAPQRRRLPKPNGRALGSHEQVIEALGLNAGLSSPAKRKRQKDMLGSLKALRTAADYTSADNHPEIGKLFRQYGVSSWEQLAEKAVVLSSQILPELDQHPRFS